MKKFDFRKSVRDSILLREGWEEKLAQLEKEDEEEAKLVAHGKTPEKKRRFGIASDVEDGENNSLQNILGKLKFLGASDQMKLINIIDKITQHITLEEAVELTGDRGEARRIVPSVKTRELLAAIGDLGLTPEENEAILKAINFWGRTNTVRFDTPDGAISTGADADGPTSSDNDDWDPDADTEEVPKPDVDLEMQKEMDRAKQAEPAISAELLDITDATSEKWGKIRNKTQNKNLQKAMDYIYNLSLAEQRYLQLLQRFKINENNK